MLAPWVPMEDLLKRRAAELKTPQQRSMYYSQAWALTHWFMSNPARRPKLVAYMKAVAGGADSAEAMQKVTGLSLDALQRELRGYVRGALPYEKWERTREVNPTIKLTRLSASADEVLLEAQQIKRRAADARLLATLRSAAARHPGDRLAVLTLAHAEISGGSRAAGEAALRRWLAGHPDDVEALEFMAEALTKGVRDEPDPAKKKAMVLEARRHLARAIRVQPDRYQSLYAYARTFSGEPGQPTRQTLEVWDRAQELAPQMPDLRLEFARALLHHDMRDIAATVLGPLLNHPHQAEAAALARTLLEKGKAEAKPAAR